MNVDSNPKPFSSEEFFNKKQVELIKSNPNNRNIYYVVTDAAIPLETYEENFKKINSGQIIEKFSLNGFNYIQGTPASYNGTHLTLSQILNLSYFYNDKSPKYNSSIIFPNVISKFDSSPLGKTLDDINYNFYWFGNAVSNCEFYLKKSCYNKTNYKHFLSGIITKIFADYTLVNFLIKTPILDISKKIFSSYKLGKSPREIAFKENDAIKKFLSTKFKKNLKNNFFLIHTLMPHGYAVPKNDPLVYNPDCTLKELTESEKMELTKDTRIKGGEDVGYESNYLCFIKRVLEFTQFIKNNDPSANVIIQADHGITKAGIDVNKIFTLAKLDKKCFNFENDQLDNINAVRLLLYCSTDQKIQLLKQQTFYEDKNVGIDDPTFQRVYKK